MRLAVTLLVFATFASSCGGGADEQPGETIATDSVVLGTLLHPDTVEFLAIYRFDGDSPSEGFLVWRQAGGRRRIDVFPPGSAPAKSGRFVVESAVPPDEPIDSESFIGCLWWSSSANSATVNCGYGPPARTGDVHALLRLSGSPEGDARSNRCYETQRAGARICIEENGVPSEIVVDSNRWLLISWSPEAGEIVIDRFVDLWSQPASAALRDVDFAYNELGLPPSDLFPQD